MKVLVYAQGFGGITLTFIYNEVVQLSKALDVLVLCNGRGFAEPVKYEKVIVAPWESPKWLRKLQWQLWQRDLLFTEWNPGFRKVIDKTITEFQPDVIHCHFGNESVRFLDNYHHNIPVLVSFHGYDATQFSNKKSYRSKLRQLFQRKGIYALFCSRFLQQRVQDMGVDTSKSHVLFYGIALERFKRVNYRKREGLIRFLQISSFTPQKGHFDTVHAIKKFVERNPTIHVEFVLGGAGEALLESTRQLVHQLKLEETVKFTGTLTPTEVKDLMEDSDYFIHHCVTGPDGETEGLPNAIIEAMAMEMPVISTYHAGIPELITDGVHGYLVKEHDLDAYVDRMEKILTWSYIKGNRERVTALCSMDHHAEQLMAIYQKIQ